MHAVSRNRINTCSYIIIAFTAAAILWTAGCQADLQGQQSTDPSKVDVRELFTPRTSLAMKLKSAGKGKVERHDTRWRITGESPLRIEFAPADQNAWDISRYRLAAVGMVNQDAGVATITGRLKNSESTDWSRHAPGFAVAPSGEKATLGFPFPLAEDQYQGPAVFKNQLGKPNGHRLHWRQFIPEDVRSLTLEIKSSTGRVDLLLEDPFLAWPADPQLDQKLQAMPYLDSLGQVNAVDWPGKARNIDAAREHYQRELTAATAAAQSRKLSRFGGWLEGPRQNATGHFRTQKIDERWWLIDPEGYLFFSVGACLAGHTAETPVTPQRLQSGFFESLPGKDQELGQIGRETKGKNELVNFPAINLARMLGNDWQQLDRNAIHTRMRAWGINTMGAWSDEVMQKEARTPYTLIASPWWKPSGRPWFPSPFKESFQADLVKALRKYEWAKDDPYCLGVFLGNELEWPDQFATAVFEMSDSDPTKQWTLERLKKKYATIAGLNAAWKTKHADWPQVLSDKQKAIPQQARNDIEPLYVEFAAAFFSRCKAALKEVMPHKLYLGCRTHRGPNVIGRGAAGHVDVFSVNVYDWHVRSLQVPADVDMPMLAGEFHFGAVDRGVPSPGLAGVWDQKQRGLAFCNYLASALADPRFVGVHWFQWIDQSAAGRSDRENHQCGIIDVTGHAYPELVELISRATQAMYRVRSRSEPTTERILQWLIKP